MILSRKAILNQNTNLVAKYAAINASTIITTTVMTCAFRSFINKLHRCGLFSEHGATLSPSNTARRQHGQPALGPAVKRITDRANA